MMEVLPQLTLLGALTVTYYDRGNHVTDTTATQLGGSLRRFGVELEASEVSAVMDAKHASPAFGVKSDGSVNGAGLEFYSPILQGDAGFDAVVALCKYAEAHGWDADDSCGYHLHLDATGLNSEQRKVVLYAYKLTEQLWARFVSVGRTERSYCRPIPLDAIEIKRRTFSDTYNYIEYSHAGRYTWCNIMSLGVHKTIEIRLHFGTFNAADVTNWIKAHLLFMDFVATKTLDEVEALFADKTVAGQYLALEKIWGDRGLSEFYRRRAKQVSTAIHV